MYDDLERKNVVRVQTIFSNLLSEAVLNKKPSAQSADSPATNPGAGLSCFIQLTVLYISRLYLRATVKHTRKGKHTICFNAMEKSL